MNPPHGSPSPSPSRAAGRATCRLGLLLLRPREAGAHEGPGVLLGGELLEASGGELVHLLLALRPAKDRVAVRPGRPDFPLHDGPCSPGAEDAGPPALAHRVEHGASSGDKARVAEHGHEPAQHRAAPPPSAPPAPPRLRGRRAHGGAGASYGLPERPKYQKIPQRRVLFGLAFFAWLVLFPPPANNGILKTYISSCFGVGHEVCEVTAALHKQLSSGSPIC